MSEVLKSARTKFAETLEESKSTVEYWREMAAMEREERKSKEAEIARLEAELATARERIAG